MPAATETRRKSSFAAASEPEAAGTQTVQEGTDAIVELATRGGGGPTGTFIDRSGAAPV